MPEIKTTRLPNAEVKIEISVEPAEYAAYFEEGAKTLSEQRPIPGFRPGHVPVAEAKRLYGDMAILEASLERIIRAFYVKALLSEGVSAVGSPSINMDKLVPGEPIQFHAIVPVEPFVKKIANLKDCVVTQKTVATSDEQVTEAVEQLRRMRHEQTLVDRAATKEDVITVDLEMKKDGVIIEGGTGNDYKVFLSEPHYLPSFTEQLLGLKAGDEKSMEIIFPAEHYQKHVAGQPVNVSIKAKAVHEITLPVIDDEFAKKIGLQSAEDLRTKLRENLTLEAEQKATESAEIEMLEKILAGTDIEEPPEILINEEVRRMLAELQHGIEEQGGTWDGYLTSIKKTVNDLRLDFVPQAMKRIKMAVLIKHVAKQENIDAPTEEVDAEIDRLLGTLRPNDKEGREQVTSADYREYVHTMMKNRKTIEWIKTQCLKKTTA